MTACALDVRNITRRFATTTAVNDVSFEVCTGELLALVGASGSGKTTTLRIVAGYEPADSGVVMLNERDITRLPPQRRNFGMHAGTTGLPPGLPSGSSV